MGIMKTTVSRVYIKLSEFIFNCTKATVDYEIAKILMNRIKELPDIYIEEIAYAANTTPSSISKLAHKLGYSGFNEMKNDTLSYFENPKRTLFDNETKIESSIDIFLDHEYKIGSDIFNSIDIDQSKRVAQNIKQETKIAIIADKFFFTEINLFRELLNSHNITIYTINRNSTPDIILDIIQNINTVFIISLTGNWIFENTSYLKDNTVDWYLMTHPNNHDFESLFKEIIYIKRPLVPPGSYPFSKKFIEYWITLLHIILTVS